ncbi:MAG: hypothetical protein EA412_00975, partial [Chitinophagaceae bacterium]
MKRISLLILLFISTNHLNAQVWEWVKSYGGVENDFGLSIYGNNEHIYLSGAFQDKIVFEGQDISSSGSKDFFISKFDHDGQFLWLSRGSSIGNNQLNSIQLDYQGALVGAGSFSGLLNIQNQQISAFQNEDFFIGRWANDGSLIWVNSGQSTGNSVAKDIRINTLNNRIAIAGHYEGSLEINNNQLLSNGSADIFFTEISSTGQFLNARSFGGQNSDRALTVTYDNAGYLYLGGYFTNSVNFDQVQLTNPGNRTAFISSFDLDKNTFWAKKIPVTGFSEINNSVIVNDTLLVSGTFTGSLDFNNNTFQSQGSNDGFIAAYDLNGNELWLKQIKSANNIQLGNARKKDNGSFVLTGNFSGNILYENRELNVSAGNYGLFFLETDAKGNIKYFFNSYSNSQITGNDIFSNDYKFFLTGNFKGNSFWGTNTASSSGKENIFFSKFNLNIISSTDDRKMEIFSELSIQNGILHLKTEKHLQNINISVYNLLGQSIFKTNLAEVLQYAQVPLDIKASPNYMLITITDS